MHAGPAAGAGTIVAGYVGTAGAVRRIAGEQLPAGDAQLRRRWALRSHDEDRFILGSRLRLVVGRRSDGRRNGRRKSEDQSRTAIMCHGKSPLEVTNVGGNAERDVIAGGL